MVGGTSKKATVWFFYEVSNENKERAERSVPKRGQATIFSEGPRRFKSCHSDENGDSNESPFFFCFLVNSREISRFRYKNDGLVLPFSGAEQARFSLLTTCLTT